MVWVKKLGGRKGLFYKNLLDLFFQAESLLNLGIYVAFGGKIEGQIMAIGIGFAGGVGKIAKAEILRGINLDAHFGEHALDPFGKGGYIALGFAGIDNESGCVSFHDLDPLIQTILSQLRAFVNDKREGLGDFFGLEPHLPLFGELFKHPIA